MKYTITITDHETGRVVQIPARSVLLAALTRDDSNTESWAALMLELTHETGAKAIGVLIQRAIEKLKPAQQVRFLRKIESYGNRPPSNVEHKDL